MAGLRTTTSKKAVGVTTTVSTVRKTVPTEVTETTGDAATATIPEMAIEKRKHQPMRKSTVLSILFALCLGACVPGHNDYSEYADITSSGWAYSHPLTFIPTVADSTCSGTLILSVRHGNAYPYRNLWIEISHPGTDGMVRHDTVNIELADIYGRWYGSGLGTSFQYSDTVSREFRIFRDSGLKIRHIMRADTLPAIEQVGIAFISDDNR